MRATLHSRMFLPWLIAIVIAFSALPASAERRVAIVIGNGAYENVVALDNPPADAKAVAELLRKVDFDVVEAADLDRNGMIARLGEFGTKAAGADVALIFYAGHGIAVGGTSYVLPIDFDPKAEASAALAAAIGDGMLARAISGAKLRILLIDAGRDNPFGTMRFVPPRDTGVPGGPAPGPEGDLILVFATAPGQAAFDGKPGERSPFTRALLAHLAAPGVEIARTLRDVRLHVHTETAGRQSPWSMMSIGGEFYMNPVPRSEKTGTPK
jgi:uncharacterized caspase-like protein